MATRTSQRIGIWIIAVVMLVGTLGAFFLPIMINNTDSQQALSNEEALRNLQEQQAREAEQQASAAEPLDGYTAEPFDGASVTELQVETLKEGEGDVAATETSTVTANYFGWTSDGKIFDSSKKGGAASPVPFGLDQVIEGWTKGLTGAKAGGVYKLVIPGDMAYGNEDDGSGRPVGPLTFIVDVQKVE